MKNKYILIISISIISIAFIVGMSITDNRDNGEVSDEEYNNDLESYVESSEDARVDIGEENGSAIDQENNVEEVVLFYSQHCSHCKRVEDFIEEENIEEKVDIEKVEIYESPENMSRLVETADLCNLNRGSYGVPFLWDGEHCYKGEKEVINFLEVF